jgi:hypothetical protein
MHVQNEYFTGFPYMLTLVSRGLFHISILPAGAGLDNLKEIVRWQVSANKLQSCLVLGSACCLYYDLDGTERPSSDIPSGGVNVAGKLCTVWEGTRSAEFTARGELLRAYLDRNGAHDMIYAELTKGGRAGTSDEFQRLEGKQSNGIPVGLTKCAQCGCWKGECLDPNPKFRGLIMRVDCQCENDTLCAACGEKLWQRRINANYYDERHGRIWYVPGFKAFSHVCQVETKPGRRRGKAGFEVAAAGAIYAR